MKKFNFKIRGHKYDVEVLNQENQLIEIEINGTQYKVELEQEAKKVQKTPTLVRARVNTHKPTPKAGSGEFKVKCPLPGNIMNIMVKVGDEVKVGDKLLVYEAMKMENVLNAEKAGKISKVLVNVGDTVLQEDVLLEISL